MESQEEMEQCETEMSDRSMPQDGRGGMSRRVLVINEHPEIRKMLVSLINQQPDVEACFEADNIEVAYRTLDKQTIDFALVDITSNPRKGTHYAELLKLRCPMLPVMAISNYPQAAIDTKQQASISTEQAERILSAIRYMQSLLRCGLLGFTVLVKDENNL
jgi:DNA-binding NarL/FixJ family response regulator